MGSMETIVVSNVDSPVPLMTRLPISTLRSEMRPPIGALDDGPFEVELGGLEVCLGDAELSLQSR